MDEGGPPGPGLDDRSGPRVPEDRSPFEWYLGHFHFGFLGSDRLRKRVRNPFQHRHTSEPENDEHYKCSRSTKYVPTTEKEETVGDSGRGK